MDFGSFLNHCESTFLKLGETCPVVGIDKISMLKGGVVAPKELFSLRESHIFHLGDDEKVSTTADEMRSELEKDASEGIPMPYSDVTEVSKLHEKWILDRLIKVTTGSKNTKIFFKYLRGSLLRDGELTPEDSIAFYDCFLFTRIEESGVYPLQWIGFRVEGSHGNSWGWITSVIFPSATQDQAILQNLANNATAICLQTILISHPMNYIVKVTPTLTPREERKVQAGKKIPIPKSPHFIVIDHDVLVLMRGDRNVGTHASPVPHHRRGHWKRLSERCKFARMMGKEKVFVKPTYVGKRSFSDEKNFYEVLL